MCDSMTVECCKQQCRLACARKNRLLARSSRTSLMFNFDLRL